MRKTMLAVGGGLVLLLGACGKDPSANDFRTQTEKFLRSDKTVQPKLGQQFTSAKCETPASTAIGTEYGCTAVGKGDGQNYAFSVKITSKSRYTVTLSGTNDTTASTTTTPAGATTTPSGGASIAPGSATDVTTAAGDAPIVTAPGAGSATTTASGSATSSGTGGAAGDPASTTVAAGSLPGSR